MARTPMPAMIRSALLTALPRLASVDFREEVEEKRREKGKLGGQRSKIERLVETVMNEGRRARKEHKMMENWRENEQKMWGGRGTKIGIISSSDSTAINN